jgi:hypothetical protein
MLVRDDSPLMHADIPETPPGQPQPKPPHPETSGSAAFDAYKALRESLGR